MGINDMDRCSMTGLLRAIYHRAMDVALKLIENGADVNLARNNGVPQSRSEWLCKQRFLVVGDIADDSWGETPLIYAIVFFGEDTDKVIHLIDALLEAGADINKTDALGNTPLHYACQTEESHVDVVSHLISKGADINAKKCSEEKERTPLHTAAIEGRVAKVEVLLKAGADINALDADGISAFIMAGYSGCLDTVKLLVKNGAEIDPSFRSYTRNQEIVEYIEGECMGDSSN